MNGNIDINRLGLTWPPAGSILFIRRLRCLCLAIMSRSAPAWHKALGVAQSDRGAGEESAPLFCTVAPGTVFEAQMCMRERKYA